MTSKPPLKRPAKKAADAPAAAPAPLDEALAALMRQVTGDASADVAGDYRPVPTGINVLDYYNGRYFADHSAGPNDPPMVLFTGLPRGKIIGFLGFTGSFKTTLAVQTGMSMVIPFAGGQLFHIDLENAWSDERTADITGLPLDAVKAKYKRTKPMSVEKIYEFCKRIIQYKRTLLADPANLVEDPCEPGKMILPPTVVLIDTVAALQMDKLLDENVSIGSALAEGGEQAKFNNLLAQRLAGLIGEVNLTVMWCNHIRDQLSTGTPKPKRVAHMGEGESIPGGHGMVQMADYILRMVGSTVLDPEKDGEAGRFGIYGRVVRCTIVKSRLSYTGRQFDLVFSANGCSNAWSNLRFLADEKAISGGGAGQFFTHPTDGTVSKKFSSRGFEALYEGDDEFRRIADAVLEERLLRIVPQPSTPEEAEVPSAPDLAAGMADLVADALA